MAEVETITPIREQKLVDCIGLHRGATLARPTFVSFNDDTTRFTLVLRGVDAYPGRAAQFRDAAQQQLGLRVEAIEADARRIAPEWFENVVVVHVDDALTLAQLLATLENRYVTFLIFIRTADRRLLTLSGAFEPAHGDAMHEAALLVGAFGYIATGGGSDRLFGKRAVAEHRLIESMFRAEFAERTRKNITKAIASLPLEEPGLRLSDDGRRSLKVQVIDSRAGFQNPALLTHQFYARPAFAVDIGETFVIAEVGAQGEVRLHMVTRRVLDGAVTVGGMPVLDPRSGHPTDAALWSLLGTQREQLLARAAAEAFRRDRPPALSD
jgi:hypothetical protein